MTAKDRKGHFPKADRRQNGSEPEAVPGGAGYQRRCAIEKGRVQAHATAEALDVDALPGL